MPGFRQSRFMTRRVWYFRYHWMRAHVPFTALPRRHGALTRRLSDRPLLMAVIQLLSNHSDAWATGTLRMISRRHAGTGVRPPRRSPAAADLLLAAERSGSTRPSFTPVRLLPDALHRHQLSRQTTFVIVPNGQARARHLAGISRCDDGGPCTASSLGSAPSQQRCLDTFALIPAANDVATTELALQREQSLSAPCSYTVEART